MQNNESLLRSNSVADEIRREGLGILNSLQIQEDALKRVKVRSLAMLAQLGMSDSILLLIERRGRADLLIFGALAVTILILMYVLLYWVKPMMALW